MFAEYTEWRSECLSNLSYRMLRVWLAQEFADSSSSHHPIFMEALGNVGGSRLGVQVLVQMEATEPSPSSPAFLWVSPVGTCWLWHGQCPGLAGCTGLASSTSVSVLGIKCHVCLAAPGYTLSRSKPWGA